MTPKLTCLQKSKNLFFAPLKHFYTFENVKKKCTNATKTENKTTTQTSIKPNSKSNEKLFKKKMYIFKQNTKLVS